MNRYLVFYDADSPAERLAGEMQRLQTLYPEPLHFKVDNSSIMIKSIHPLGRFMDTTGFGDNGGINGFVIQIYNINGWYRTQLWDWYYSKD